VHAGYDHHDYATAHYHVAAHYDVADADNIAAPDDVVTNRLDEHVDVAADNDDDHHATE
jgi:hypothetical protein